MNRINQIRENLKVKEQGCKQMFILEQMEGITENGICGIYGDLCHTCKATLKTTISENLKEAESMIEELESDIDDWEKLPTVKTKASKWQLDFTQKKIVSLKEQKAEWQKLRDEIKLKLENLNG